MSAVPIGFDPIIQILRGVVTRRMRDICVSDSQTKDIYPGKIVEFDSEIGKFIASM
jgi:hypothetical protein